MTLDVTREHDPSVVEQERAPELVEVTMPPSIAVAPFHRAEQVKGANGSEHTPVGTHETRRLVGDQGRIGREAKLVGVERESPGELLRVLEAAAAHDDDADTRHAKHALVQQKLRHPLPAAGTGELPHEQQQRWRTLGDQLRQRMDFALNRRDPRAE